MLVVRVLFGKGLHGNILLGAKVLFIERLQALRVGIVSNDIGLLTTVHRLVQP